MELYSKGGCARISKLPVNIHKSLHDDFDVWLIGKQEVPPVRLELITFGFEDLKLIMTGGNDSLIRLECFPLSVVALMGEWL